MDLPRSSARVQAWLRGVSTERVEPLVPLFLGVHGLAAGAFASSPPHVMALFAAVAVAGAAGLLGWQAPGAARARAALTLAVALAAQLLEPDLVSSMLQWYYAVVAVYSLLLVGRAAILVGPATAGCFLIQWANGVGPTPGEVAALRAGVLVALGFTMYVAGRAYRIERDTARAGRAAAEQATRELEHVANHDQLTGLLNRRGLFAELSSLLAAPEDTGDRLTLTVLDLSRFADVNDTFGHDAGDRLLHDIGDRLAGAPGVRLAARLGGAEFACVTTAAPGGKAGLDAEAPADPDPTVRGVLRTLGASYVVQGQEHHVAFATGAAARHDLPDAGPDGLMRAANLALQAAKRAGPFRVVAYRPEMALAATARVALEQQLRVAVRDGQLRVAYQPVVDVHTGRLCGVEALARWTSPEGTAIPPDVFIPLAEELGLVGEVGRQVLTAALEALTQWAEAGLDVPTVSVNVSPLQLQAPTFPETVAVALAACGLEPDRLVLEVTEGAVIQAPPVVVAALEIVRATGVGISLDDFGTGYSSLARLRDLPVTELKIDRSFVAELDTDPVLTSLVLNLATSLGLRTVAEGVETAEQLQLLRELGAHAAQGYHLARPMPASELGQFLAATLASPR